MPFRPMSDEIRAAIVALKAAKPAMTAPQIGKALGVAAGTAANVLRTHRADAVAAQEAAATEVEASAAAMAPVTLQGVVERLRAEVPRLEALAETLRKAGDLRGYASIVKQRTDLLDRLAEHEQVTGPDPEIDPLNVEARATLVQRLRELVEREEAGQRHAAAARAMVPGGAAR